MKLIDFGDLKLLLLPSVYAVRLFQYDVDFLQLYCVEFDCHVWEKVIRSPCLMLIFLE